MLMADTVKVELHSRRIRSDSCWIEVSYLQDWKLTRAGPPARPRTRPCSSLLHDCLTRMASTIEMP